MKAILMSIRPEWVAKILNGEKTIEIRKTLPKCDLPIDVYIYCTKKGELVYVPAGERFYYYEKENIISKKCREWNLYFSNKVVAKFTLNKVEEITKRKVWGEWECYGKHTGFIELSKKSCLSQKEIMTYLGANFYGYAWHIDNLVIFDKPKELSEFKVRRNDCPFPCGICDVRYCKLKRSPQSWQFIEI